MMSGNKKRKLVPPDGGWGWVVVFGVGLVNLSTKSLEPSFGLLFGSLLQDLSIATTGAGIIISTYEAIVNFSGIFVGPLTKTYSYRKIAMFAALLTSTGLTATFPANSITHILITYSIIAGFGIGVISSATFVSINYYFKEKLGQAVGMAMAGSGLGFLLMPQLIRYLAEEYNFAGSMLIIGAFSLNALVGSALLQPIKWHMKEVADDEEEMLNSKKKIFELRTQNSETKLQSRHSTCPRITIEHIIKEEHNDYKELQGNEENSILSLESQGKPEEKVSTRRVSEFRPRFYLSSKPYRKFSLNEHLANDSALVNKRRSFVQKPLNKSSTEIKFDSYFYEGEGTAKPLGRKQWFAGPFAKLSHSSASINNKLDMQILEFPANLNIRKRKNSVISNLSSLDVTGSCLYLQVLENDFRNEGGEATKKKEAEEPFAGKGETVWRKIVAFMDFDLLKDPVYLNILFGVSIFYVAEANFKMIVPFFLIDLGHSKAETAFCLSIMAASDIAARLILPPLFDRMKISKRTLFMSFAVLCGISRSVLAESHGRINLETILIINGFFRGATLINFMLVIPEYCTKKLNKLPAALGIHMVAKGIFLISAGPLIGLVRDLTQSFPICIHVQNVFIAICVIAWSLEGAIKRSKKKLVQNNKLDVNSIKV